MRRALQTSLTIQFNLFFLMIILLSGSSLAYADSPVPWSEFRGPEANGHADAKTTIPLKWSETENVTWKTSIPLSGWSSPVIEKDVLWMTTASEEGHDFYVLGVSADSGEIVYNESVFHVDNPEPLGNSVNGYASPTSAIRDGRLYVHFGTYGTACIDTATRKVMWKREDLHCSHFRGPGSSVMLFEDLLILTFDGIDVQYVIALDTATGDTVWRRDRSRQWDDLDEEGKPYRNGDMRKAYSTPVIAQVNGKPLLLSVGAAATYGYDPRTGEEIWSTSSKGFSACIRPIFHNDLAIFGLGYGTDEFRALRLDGVGEVSDTHVAWRINDKRLVPSTPSPVVVDGLLYLLTDRGTLTCLDAENGDVIWSEHIGGSYIASLIVVQGRIYCFSKNGKTTVIDPGRSFTVLATSELEEGLMASPAVFDNALYLRTKTQLYRIEE